MQKMSRTCKIVILLFINADVKHVALQILKLHQVAFYSIHEQWVCISDCSVQSVTGLSLSKFIKCATITKQMAPNEVQHDTLALLPASLTWRSK